MRVVRSLARKIFKRTVVVVIALSLLILCADKLLNYTAKILFPIEHSAEVQKYCNEFGVSKSLCYAVIKCESNFEPEAKSSAGALGLMQLTPETFRWVCKKIYDFEVEDRLILDTATNIKCGVWLISYLQKEFKGEAEVIAAYNAGITKVKGWLNDPQISNDGQTLTNIPYEETETYVKRVLRTKKTYQKLYNLE